MKPALPISLSLAIVASACSRTSRDAPAVTVSPEVSVPPDVSLPTSTATQAPSRDALLVVLSPRRLALGADGPTLAEVPPPDGAPYGLEARYKESSRSDLRIVPLANAIAS